MAEYSTKVPLMIQAGRSTGFDNQKAAELESEIQGLKSKIKLAGDKYGISPCCRG